MAELKSLEQWRKNRIAVSAAAAGVWLGNTLVLPFLPLFVQDLGVEGVGAVAFWTGLLFAVSPALAALTGPVWGKIGDRYGLKLVTARAAAGNSLCWLLMIFAENVWHVLWIRILLGVMGGFNNLSVAAITQLTPKSRNAQVIGGLQSTQILSAAVGPMAGGLLAHAIGIRNTFLVAALIMFAAFLSIAVLYQDRAAAAPSGPGGRRRSSWAYLKRPDYLLPMLILFSIQMTDRTYTPITPLFLEQLGTPAARLMLVAGALFSAAALVEAFSAWLSGHAAARIPLRWFLAGRLGLGVGVLGLLALSQTPTAFFFWRIALALVAGGTLTLAFAAAGEAIPPEERGAGYSLLSSTLMLGGSLGPVVSGLLAGLGLRAVFVFNLAVYLLLTLAVLRYGRALDPLMNSEQ